MKNNRAFCQPQHKKERILERQEPAKIGLFHLSLNPYGGAERLALMMCQALRDSGHEVDLVVTQRPDWNSIRKSSGSQNGIASRVIVIPPFIRIPTIYSTFFYWILRDAILCPALKGAYDLTITTKETLPLVFSDLIYIHTPDWIPDFLHNSYDKYSTGLMKAYCLPFKLLARMFIQVFNALPWKPIVITNSQFTRSHIRKHLHVDPLVVYPGVDTAKYSPSSIGKRENIVLTISRIEEKKGLGIITELAKRVTDARFVILGLTHHASNDYISRLTSEARMLGVEDRVLFMPNATESQKIMLLSTAKVYLHTMRFEHFGISVVEGMSAGLVPVVHRSGGPWVDILSETQGQYGYAYDDITQAEAVINELLHNERIRIRVARRALSRAQSFDSNRFSSSMVKIVEMLVERKNSGSSREQTQLCAT